MLELKCSNTTPKSITPKTSNSQQIKRRYGSLKSPKSITNFNILTNNDTLIRKYSQACDRCRIKKIKCLSNFKNGCLNCNKINFKCITSDKLSRRGLPKGYTEYLESIVIKMQSKSTSSNTTPSTTHSTSNRKYSLPIFNNLLKLDSSSSYQDLQSIFNFKFNFFLKKFLNLNDSFLPEKVVAYFGNSDPNFYFKEFPFSEYSIFNNINIIKDIIIDSNDFIMVNILLLQIRFNCFNSNDILIIFKLLLKRNTESNFIIDIYNLLLCYLLSTDVLLLSSNDNNDLIDLFNDCNTLIFKNTNHINQSSIDNFIILEFILSMFIDYTPINNITTSTNNTFINTIQSTLNQNNKASDNYDELLNNLLNFNDTNDYKNYLKNILILILLFLNEYKLTKENNNTPLLIKLSLTIIKKLTSLFENQKIRYSLILHSLPIPILNITNLILSILNSNYSIIIPKHDITLILNSWFNIIPINLYNDNDDINSISLKYSLNDNITNLNYDFYNKLKNNDTLSKSNSHKLIKTNSNAIMDQFNIFNDDQQINSYPITRNNTLFKLFLSNNNTNNDIPISNTINNLPEFEQLFDFDFNVEDEDVDDGYVEDDDEDEDDSPLEITFNHTTANTTSKKNNNNVISLFDKKLNCPPVQGHNKNTNNTNNNYLLTKNSKQKQTNNIPNSKSNLNLNFNLGFTNTTTPRSFISLIYGSK